MTAADKTTGKTSKITITNDKGRLSKEDIEQMVADAEKYAAEDAAVAERVAARNGLESYAYSLRNTLQDDKLADKWQGDDKATLQAAVDEAVRFVEESQEASKEEYDDHRHTLESVANPVMTRVHGGGGAGAAPGPSVASTEPSVEEVRS